MPQCGAAPTYNWLNIRGGFADGTNRAFEWIAPAQLGAVEGYLGDTLFGGASTPTER